MAKIIKLDDSMGTDAYHLQSNATLYLCPVTCSSGVSPKMGCFPRPGPIVGCRKQHDKQHACDAATRNHEGKVDVTLKKTRMTRMTRIQQ